MSVKLNPTKKEFRDKEFVYKNPCNEETFDIRGVKVLSKNEWERIQYNLNKKEMTAQMDQQEKEKREMIKECSQNLVKDWTNTVLKGSGARQKKLAERKARLEDEEKERKAVDLAESQYQAEKRRKAIEEAKTKQYYQTDRVKNFHSALLYTEVLKERDAQIELKRLKELSECNRDGGFLDKARREYEEALKADQEKTAERIRQTKENTNFLKSQIKYNHEVQEKEMQDLLTEGENVRRLAVAHALEKQRLDQIDREEQRLRMTENLRQIDDVKRMKEIDRLRNEEDDEEIRIFAAAKKKMLKLRLEREREIYTEKQNNLERIKEKLSAQLKAKMDDEDSRIKNAITEKEEKFNADEAEKEQKRLEMQKSIDEYRHDTHNRLEQDKRSNKQRELDALLARKEADIILKEYEEKRQEIRRAEIKRLAEENLVTAKEMKENDEFSRGSQLKVQEENQRLLNLEEKVFQEYAQKVIEHCEKGKRNTYPLKKAANRGIGGGLGPTLPGGINPSYMTSSGKGVELPTFQGQRERIAREEIVSNATSDNLGFVWKKL